MMYFVELDMCADIEDSQIHKFANEHGCSVSLVEEFGPGGGNPLYKFSSTSYDCLVELAWQVLEDYQLAEEVVEVE